LWVKSDIPQQSWQKALKDVVFGGERRYGWGRVSLVGDLAQDSSPPIQDPDHFSWATENGAPAHVRCTPAAHGKIKGVIEPLVGWEARGNFAKVIGENALIAYVPGCRMNTEVSMRISEQPGMWEVLDT
jgi:hypothetical protein